MPKSAPAPAGTPAAGIKNRPLGPGDLASMQALQDRVFGPGRFVRTAYRVREGAPSLSQFCRGAFQGSKLVASLRLTPVRIGSSSPHLLLGPLAVDPDYAGQGFGKALVTEALAAARLANIGAVVLIGDLSYYERLGFNPVPPGQIVFPGPVNPARILAHETTPGALSAARGLVAACH